MNIKAPSKPAPLGRGLSALFGDADASYQPRALTPGAVASATNKQGSVQTLPIEWVQPGAYQPRRHFDEDAIKELAESIKERGILQPLMVRPIEGEKDCFELIAGERRWRAAQLVGLHEVPVIVKEMTDREAMEIGLIENVQRQDLSPLEEAEGYRRLIEEFSHSQEGLSRVVGKSRPHITNLLRLLTLPESVKKMVDEGQLSMGHARSVLTAKNPVAMANEIVKRGLSVRQCEVLAKKESEGRFAKHKKEAAKTEVDADVIALEKELERMVGLRVKIASQGKAGSLTLFYANLDQLEGLVQRLQG